MSKHFEENRCSICKNTYRSPKSLNCLHVFCSECLHDSLKSENTIICKNCGESHKLTHKLIDSLPDHLPYATITRVQNALEQIALNSDSILCDNCTYEEIDGKSCKAIAYCIYCQLFLCEFDKNAHLRFHTTHEVKSLDEVSYSPLCSLLPPKPAIFCNKHRNLDVSVYCPKCDLACCEWCGTLEHNSHNVKKIQESEDTLLNTLNANFEKAKKEGDENEKKMVKLIHMLEQIRISRDNTINQMNAKFQRLVDVIEARKKHFETQINDHFESQEILFKNHVSTIDVFTSKLADVEDYYTALLGLFPTNYLFSTSNIINARLHTLKESIPKRELKVHKIEFEMPGSETKELESKMNKIGKISRMAVPDFSKASEVLVASDFGYSNDFTFNCIAQEDNNLNMLLSQKNTDNSIGPQDVHIIDASLRNVESVSSSLSIGGPNQMVKMASGNILITDTWQKNVVVVNETGNECKTLTNDEENIDPASISLIKRGDQEDNVIVYDQKQGQLHVLNKELEHIRKIQVQDVTVPVPRQRNNSTSSNSSGGGSRPNSKLVSRLSRTNSPDCVFAGTGNGTVRSGTCSPFPSGVARKVSNKQSQSVATNSQHQILIAQENEATFSTYNLNGKKLDKVDYQKHLDTEIIPITRTNSASLRPKTSSTLNSVGLSRSQSMKRTSSPLIRSMTPKTSLGSSTERTLITTDKLDNIYICRRKQILTFDDKHNLIRKDKLQEKIDPVSFSVNPFGEAYILSSKGELHRFSLQE